MFCAAAREFLLKSAQAAWQDDDAEDVIDAVQQKGNPQVPHVSVPLNDTKACLTCDILRTWPRLVGASIDS